MSYIAKTDADGVNVGPNAAVLQADLDASALTCTIDYDVFQAGQTIIIDQEHMLLTARGTTPTFAARGGDDTDAAVHYSGARVREKNGKTVLSHTFDGSTWLSQINVGADNDIMYEIEIDGVRSRGRSLTVSSSLSDDFPFVRYKPTAGTVIKVIAWCWSVGNVWAEFKS